MEYTDVFLQVNKSRILNHIGLVTKRNSSEKLCQHHFIMYFDFVATLSNKN